VVQQGELLTWLGRPEEGIEWIRRAMRLNPYHPERFWSHLGRAQHTARAYAGAIASFSIGVGSFGIVTRQTWRIGWESRSSDEERPANVELHARIAAAIEARERRVAKAAMAEHFDGSVKALLSPGVI
jgi:FCD domain